MGYCSRCGDVVHGDSSRCRCGGLATTAKSSQVLSEGRPVTPEGSDRWSRQYVSRSPSSTPKGSLSYKTATASAASPGNYFNVANGKNSQRSTSSKASKHLSLPMMSPSLEQCEETIARAFGSVLDPQNKRAKWACAACNTMFVRDQTVYPDPRAKDDPTLADTLYCPSCFADRFSLGDCDQCGASVLPDAAAPFVARKDKLWHAACYSCLYCSKDLSKSPQVDLYGNPCCSRCFDTAAFLKSPTVEHVPALLSANEPDNQDASKNTQSNQKKTRFVGPEARLGPAVNELRARLEKAGLEKSDLTELGSAPATEEVKSPKFGGNYSFGLPPVSSPRMEMKSPSFGTAGSYARPPPSQKMELKSPRFGSAATFQAPPHSTNAEKSKAISYFVNRSDSAVQSTSSGTQLKSPTVSQSYFSHSHGNEDKASSVSSAKPVVAPPMLRSRSDNPSSTIPAWQRHRNAQSVAGLSSTSTAVPPSSRPPVSPVMAQIARFENSNASSGVTIQSSGQASTQNQPPKFARPQRTGRTQSMFNVPSVNQLKSPTIPLTSGFSNNVEPAEKPAAAPVKRDFFPKSSSFDRASGIKAPLSTQQTVSEPAKPLLRTRASRPDLPKASPAVEKRQPERTPAVHESRKDAPPPSSVLSADSRCTGCQLRLFSVGAPASGAGAEKNKVITLPGSGENYHARCFVCGICKNEFEEGFFVGLEGGKKVHERCAPPLKADFTKARLPSQPSSSSTMPIPSRPKSDQLPAPPKPFRTCPSITSLQHSSAAQVTPLSPSKIQIKVKPSTGPTKLSKASEVFASTRGGTASAAKNFGGMYSCAGCGEGATMAETTLGPVGTRFHHRCLKCACGKKLDSGAKSLESPNENGEMKPRFACRDCIDKDRLAKRSLSSVSGMNALRGRI